jgi:iron(III) transport system permease protein
VFGASILDASGNHFTLANYITILSNRFFLNGLTNSLGIAASAAICTVLVGVPFAFCLARLPIGGKAVLLALAALPLVLPSFVSAYALVLLFGRSGIVTGMLQSIGIPFESIYGAKGIVVVYTLTLYPYVVLPVTAAFKAIDVSVEEAAQNLGASRARMLRTVTLPLVLPSISAGALARVHRGAGEFRRAVRARRGQADPLGRGLQAVRRRDRPTIRHPRACSACC